jgi:feruloyl esterase
MSLLLCARPTAVAIVVIIASAAPAPALAAPHSASSLPTVACPAMNGQQVPASAIALPTGGATVTSATLVAAAGGVPEYCAIRGTIASLTAGAPSIDFGVDIPTAWNDEAWQLGGSGNDGALPNLANQSPPPSGGPPPPGPIPQPYLNVEYPPNEPPLIAQGYATYGSDSGHQSQADWALSDEAWMNFAYQQIKKTHDTVMAIIRVMYSRAPARNYWIGGSQGGREGLEAITRYPNDYDGAIVNVPLAYFASLILNPAYQERVQAAPGAWIGPRQQLSVAKDVLNTCDATDGADDGVIDDYLGCDAAFNPTLSPHAFASLACRQGASPATSGCLSAAQMATLRAIYGPVRYPYQLTGYDSYPGWGTGLEGTGWLWDSTQPTYSETTAFGGWSLVQQRFSGNATGSFTIGDLQFAKLKTQMQALSQQLDVPDTLQAWLRHHGKLIMVTNASDSVSNPQAQMKLYNRWVALYGRAAVKRSVSYYVEPNEGHGAGATDAASAVIPDYTDLTAQLTRWVGTGSRPPAHLIATNMSSTAPYNVTATKPVCSFPTYPRYRGAGPLNSAARYRCQDPLDDLAAAIRTAGLTSASRTGLDRELAVVRRRFGNTARVCHQLGILSADVGRVTSPHASSGVGTTSILAAIATERLAAGCLSK